ncbi:phage portal protein [Cerasicoccus arenae]|uniref:Phage portal protein n=1 Tax=Cerasicoccus arenae TaxID=424488 RepID=A0A8J3DI50_9BACT|nr:phage portal protein [Cerasicoccus arenae]MBK1858231.1 phage portal protein [Cerasicoccus arenae]GHC02045.1 hypothetical protein GCM10007047_18180 [Cerasicoccus arenae]
MVAPNNRLIAELTGVAPKEKRSAVIQMAPGYYDASNTNRERDWGPVSSGGVFEDHHFTDATRSITLARLRKEIRNNPYLAGLVNKFPEAVGYSNLRSRTPVREYNEAKELFWFRWSKSVTVAGDSLRTLEEIILRELLIAGEVFLVLLNSGKVQVVPSEFCGSPWLNGASADSNEINGIRYNAVGRPQSYRFGQSTIFGTVDFSDRASTVVQARNVLHVYHKDRVLMGRGLPWLLPSLATARDLYEITRAKTKQIKDVTSLIGYLKKSIDSEGIEKFMRGYDPEEEAEPTAATADDAADEAPATGRKIVLAPGSFPELEEGESIELLNSEYQAQDYKELIMLMLHAISSPVGLPVELWFSGLGDVNYSGFKGLGTQWNARRKYILNLLEGNYLDRLHFWRINKAANEGELPPNPVNDDDLIEWAWKRTAVLDDEKHAKSVTLRLKSGERILADFWEEDGLYEEEVLERRRQFYIKAMIAAGELAADVDPTTVKVPLTFLLKNEIPGSAPDKPENVKEDASENQDRAA